MKAERTTGRTRSGFRSAKAALSCISTPAPAVPFRTKFYFLGLALTILTLTMLVMLATAFAADFPYDFSSPSWHCQHASRNPWDPYPVPGGSDSRGIAFSPDGKHFYLGNYVFGGGNGLVFKITNDPSAVAISQYTNNVEVRLQGPCGHAIAVDDMGRVYLASGEQYQSLSKYTSWKTGQSPVTYNTTVMPGINIFDSDLQTLLWSTNLVHDTWSGWCYGIAVRRENGKLVMYNTMRGEDEVWRWELGEDGLAITNAVRCGLTGDGNNDGVVLVHYKKEGNKPEGIDIDDYGNIWVACFSEVWRCDPNGTNWVQGHEFWYSNCWPRDVVCDGAYVYASMQGGRSGHYCDSVVTVFKTNDLETIVAQFNAPAPAVLGATNGSVYCIDTIPGSGKFYLSSAVMYSAATPTLLEDYPNWRWPVYNLTLPTPTRGTLFEIDSGPVTNAALPFVETFESIAVGPLDGSNNWAASPTSNVRVESQLVYAGSRAASVDNAAAWHGFNDASATNVWLDWYAWCMPRVGNPSLDSGVTAAFYVRDDGSLVATSNTTWVALGTVTNAIATTGVWTRFTVNLNYASSNWALYVADSAPNRLATPVATNLKFSAGASSTYLKSFKMSNH